MPIMECLNKMGFSRDEAQVILEDIGDGKAHEVVRQHIKLLEDERASIMKQAAIPKDMAPAVADNLSMEIPHDGEVMPARDAIARADAEIEIAKQESQGYEEAAACALRG